ncbi:MAG: Gfo/Idh/MocA family oxidoreductase [Ruminococcaceae bacterium]|nr:Gfo/Idh/MocA family oxidoreductase [Oscillospiraceae bacterium]
MRKIKIAQIGMNRYSHAPEIFHTMKIHPELFDLVGYALVEDERETCAAKIEKFFAGYPELTLEQILSDPTIEAVAVETDEIHLTKYAQMAADAGKHIHMEKPGSQNLADFERLIETVRRNGKTFHIGYMYRYNPLISRAIEDAKNGKFGQIYSVEAHMSRFDKKATREWFGSFKGGMMFYLGCHLIDLVLQIQGMPTEVLPLNTRTGLDGVDTEDLGFAVLRYPNGISVIRMGGTEVGGSRRRQLVICGSERTLEIKPLEVSIKEAAPYTLYAEQTDYASDESGHTVLKPLRSEPFQRYEAMLFAFAEMVRGERENPYTLEYELQLFKLILRCCGMEV